METENIEAK